MRPLRKHVIDLLLKQSSSTDIVFGDLIAKVLFHGGEMALLVDVEQNSCRLFHSSMQGIKDCFLLLTDVIGLIDSLEKKGLIFISDNDQIGGLELFYADKDDFHETQIPGEFFICDEQRLVLVGEIPTIIGYHILKGELLPEKMYSILVHVFCGRVYPTKGLEDYVNRGYRTWEEESAKRSQRVAWIAIFVSIVIGIVSICLKK